MRCEKKKKGGRSRDSHLLTEPQLLPSHCSSTFHLYKTDDSPDMCLRHDLEILGTVHQFGFVPDRSRLFFGPTYMTHGTLIINHCPWSWCHSSCLTLVWMAGHAGTDNASMRTPSGSTTRPKLGAPDIRGRTPVMAFRSCVCVAFSYSGRNPSETISLFLLPSPRRYAKVGRAAETISKPGSVMAANSTGWHNTGCFCHLRTYFVLNESSSVVRSTRFYTAI